MQQRHLRRERSGALTSVSRSERLRNPSFRPSVKEMSGGSSPPHTVVCAAHGLRYDPAQHSGCVICRRHLGSDAAKSAASSQRSFAGLLLASSLLALGVVGAWWWYRAGSGTVKAGNTPRNAPVSAAPNLAAVTSVAQALSTQSPSSLGSSSLTPSIPARRGVFTARNSFGRSGAYYLPPNYQTRALPLVVLFHGTGVDGSVALGELLPLAEAKSLLVVAPDSGRAPDGTATWQVGDHPGDRTADFEHSRACLREFEALPGVRIQRRLALGYSGGGSSAPYFATNDSRFDAFAVLHGGIFVGGFGGYARRGWFSTGQSDGWRSPAQVRVAAEQARGAGVSVTMREFPGGHNLALPEIEAALDWWLGQ